MFTFKKNEKTGLQETNFPGKLISISEKVLTNVNGTQYHVGTIEFINAKGQEQRINGFMYQKNYSHGVTVGNSYLCTATHNPQVGVLVTISHLEGSGVRPDAQMFGFTNSNVETPASEQRTLAPVENLAGV